MLPDDAPARRVTTSKIIEPPAPSTLSSQRGNARPQKKTAARAASSSGSVFKYSLTRRTFSFLLDVAPTASPVSAKRRIQSTYGTSVLHFLHGRFARSAAPVQVAGGAGH